MSFAQVVASWPAPNYADPVTRGDGIVIASAVFGSLATIAIALRAYSKICVTHTFGSDDILILLAWAWSIAMMICLSIASREYGFNKHIWDVPFDKLRTYNVYSLLFQVTFSLASTFTKLSLLWFCRRVIGDGRKISWGFHDSAIVVLMGAIVVFETLYLIMLFLQCRPLKALFEVVPTYHYVCTINSYLLTYAGSIANTITDFLTTLIPVTLIGKLHLPYRQRIVIMGLFALGATVNIAGALRTYYMHTSMLVKDLDRSWVGWPTCISAIVEIGLGVIVTSVPAFRPLIGRFWPFIFESRRKYRYQVDDESPGILFKSETKPCPSRSIFALKTFDKPWAKGGLFTSKVSTSQSGMNNTRSFEQPRAAINATQTWRQDSLNIAPSPEPSDSISRFGTMDERVDDNYERFRFDFMSEEQHMSRFYEDDSEHGHP